MTISMAGLPAFTVYYLVGTALIDLFAAVYLRLTAHDEIALVRSSNPSAALAFSGNLVGFPLPLEKAIAQAGSLVDCMLWALVALVIQFAAYGVSRPDPGVVTQDRAGRPCVRRNARHDDHK